MAARLDWATAHPKDAKEVLERRGVDAVILITYHRGVPSAVVAGRTPGLTFAAKVLPDPGSGREPLLLALHDLKAGAWDNAIQRSRGGVLQAAGDGQQA